jgi:hypothetical protein
MDGPVFDFRREEKVLLERQQKTPCSEIGDSYIYTD